MHSYLTAHTSSDRNGNDASDRIGNAAEFLERYFSQGSDASDRPHIRRPAGVRQCTVPRDPSKTAKIIGWLNVGQADVEAEAPIKGLPMDSSTKLDQLRIIRKPPNWGFRPNIGWADVGTASIFCRFSSLLTYTKLHTT